ncbi:RNA methyltransferase [Galbibacter sp. EGI 63066]|uniref:TrmH family RNA methyltransferase n=1 Tax=Galbibacter sp. EGI 63066 TaxID=2993559 RepID=UPI002248A846|nr:RNA methyltransferase [Galbibacter sp. EGI 63066]MCX2680361.1 RNA methyltransferase [Galbibacter sp. EGI 63066]
MVSKSEIKLITSLQQKKYRNKHRLFVAEGIKVVKELLKSDFSLYKIYATHIDFPEITSEEINVVSDGELKKMSSLKTPNVVLAVFHTKPETKIAEEGLEVALDDVRDPGNLGTIIRLCDWFGVSSLVCSENTVDCYNPKVVQASMGSLARVDVTYLDLENYLRNTQSDIFCATMGGKNIYKTDVPQNAILVMGNEANGISDSVLSLVKNEVSIPRFGEIQETESLNVATATAILLSEFKRR